MKKIFYFAVLLSLCLVQTANAVNNIQVVSQTSNNSYVTYMMFTGESIKVGWNRVLGAEKYQVRLFHIETETYTEFEWGYVRTMEIFPESVGHYVVQVRSMDRSGNISNWSESTDNHYSIVNSKPRSWWFYVYDNNQ
jgi:hypothetical protein